MMRIEDDHFHDHCGVCGVSGHAEAAKLTYLGLYALQHRGQESAGIVSSNGASLHLEKGMGLVQEIFQPEVLARLRGTVAVGHTRYSTAGDTSLINAQPMVVDCNKGKMAQRCCMDRGGNGIPPFPSRSVRRCVRTQAVRARSLCSGLFDRVGPP